MNVVKSLVFLIITGGLLLLSFILPAPNFLQAERRVPETVPALTLRNISSGALTSRFESAAADNFPFREQFRALRAATVLGVFLQSDKNGLYADEYGVGEIKPADESSIARLVEKINEVSAELSGANVYYSFIPDKSWYAEKKRPGFDAEAVKEIFTPNGTYIDLTTALNAESFYRTDLHWNQAKLGEAAKALTSGMGIKAPALPSPTFAGEFEGVYAGQMALPIGADELWYADIKGLTAQCLNATLTKLEARPVYDASKLMGIDPYDFFLQGAQPLVVINNANAATGRELFVFRDSFSSSLAPLLAASYARVTLIDLRYTNMTTVRKFVNFPPGAEVLFLYSSQVLNRAEVLM